MDFNTLLYGGISIFSLVVFFYLGRFRASSRQVNREDRIDWSSRTFSLWRVLLYSLVIVVGIAVMTKLL